MLIQITISELILWSCLFLVLFLVGFLMAFVWILMQRLKENTKLAHFSLIAGAYALIETKSIKHSDVIRKVVERHIPMPPKEMKQFETDLVQGEDEWQRFLDPLYAAESKRVPARPLSGDDFAIDETYDPAMASAVKVEDLV